MSLVLPVGGAGSPSGGLTDTQLRASAVPVTFSGGVDVTDRAARLLGHVTIDNASIAVTFAGGIDVTDRAARLLGHVTVDNASIAVTGTFWQATQPVSLAAAVDVSDRAGRLLGVVASIAAAVDISDRVGRLLGHVTVDNASLAVTGTFWQATQPVSLAAAVDVSDRAARLLGHVTVDNASLAVTGPLTDAQLRAAVVPINAAQWIGSAAPTVGQKTMASAIPVVIASDQSAVPVSAAAASVLFAGRASTFRTPGRAGTTGQKILSLHNATGSAVKVYINKVVVDVVSTVVKAVTVLPPVVRLWKVTVLPTNGTALAKTRIGGTTTSNASVTVLGDASADGTGSASALTATLPAGTFLTQEFAPRFITAAGYEMADRMEFVPDVEIELLPLEGIVVFLDYVLATQNPTTDMWIASVEWYEK